MRSAPPRSALLTAAAVSVAAFLLYRYTAAPDLTLVDSAELALAAATGGVAHPPGFPLFLLIGRAFATLPFAEPVRMLNLMSAFFVALTCGTVVLSVERMLAIAAPRDDEPAGRTLSGAIGAVAFATAWNPWVWSGVTEVYALNVFLLGAAWTCAWCGVVAASDSPPGRGVPVSGVAWRWITASAVLASLSLANHHATGVLAGPVLLGMLAWARPRALRAPRFWGTIGAAVALSLSLYLYLFIASRQDVALNWGGIDSFSHLLRHVSGQQYSLQLGSSSEEAFRVARLFVTTLVTGVGWLPAVLVGVAVAFSARRRATSRVRAASRGAALVVLAPLAMIGLNLALSMAYVAGPEDRMAYDLPATVAWCLLVGVGARGLLGLVRPRTATAAGPGFVAYLVAGVATTLLVTWNVRHHFDSCNLRHERSARLLVEESLRNVGERGVVMTAEWNLFAPYLYMRHVEGFRTDARVIDVLMMRRFWYMDYLERAHPELLAESREAFEPLRAEIVRFDLGRPYDAAAIQRLYDGLVLRWIALGLEAGGAFADGSCYEHPQELGWLNARYSVPDGLLVRFLPDASPVTNVALSPYDRDNLVYLRSRITDRSVESDLSDLPERHHPYFRVWRTYQSAVEASLFVATRTGREAFEARATAYDEWFPELGAAVTHALQRATAAGS